MARSGWAVVLAVSLVAVGSACGRKGGDAQTPVEPTPTPPTTTTPTPTPPKPGITFGTQGPWPVQNTTYGASDGILETPVVAVTTDEAENRWVATPRALYVLRPGDKTFRRYDELDGLHLGEITGRTPGPVGWVKYCDNVPIPDDRACGGTLEWGGANVGGILSLVGGAPNQVFVGYEGTHPGYGRASSVPPPICTSSDPNHNDPGFVYGYDWCDPNAHSGKVDMVKLNADGTLTVARFDFLSNNHGRNYWHDRIVSRLAYDHFVNSGTLYAGTEHGVDLVFPGNYTPFTGTGFDTWINTWLGDHLHAEVCYHAPCTGDGNLRLGGWEGLAIAPDGQLWHAGYFTAGRISWVSDPVQWMSRGGAAFTAGFGDPYPTAPNNEGYVGEPVFKVLQEGDAVRLSGVAVCPDGQVWFSSHGPENGTTNTVARWTGRHFDTWDATALGLAENTVQDIVCLPDGRVVLAGPTTGLVFYDPATNTSKTLRAGQGIPSDRVMRLELDRMTNPPALNVATQDGAAILRVLP